MAQTPSSRIFIVFIVLTLIWGTTWAAIRVGLEGIPPFTGVSARFVIAGVVLMAVVLARRVPLGRKPHERWLWVVHGVLSYCVSYGVTYWCEQWLPSGLTSVIFATFPLFTVLFAHLLVAGERMRLMSALGALTGFAGIAVIYSEDFDLLGGPQVMIAAIVMLVSPAVAALASVLIKRFGGDIHPLSLTAVPMLIAGGVMGGVAAATERAEPVNLNLPSVAALLYLAIIGSAVTFTLYFWLLRRTTANKAALIAYTTPVIAVLLGVAAFDEPFTVRTLVGSLFVMAGVIVASRAGKA